MIKRIAQSVLRHKKTVIGVFLAAVLVLALMIPLVRINYRLADYLPDDAPSTTALDVMSTAFGHSVPNLTVMTGASDPTAALAFKEKLAASPGVLDVLWLDDTWDLRTPLETAPETLVLSWYRDGQARYLVTVDKNGLAQSVSDIRAAFGDRAMFAGEAVEQAEIQNATLSEVPKILLYVFPLILIILLLSTSSWLEPLLFLIIIGVAIVLNEGSNILLGDISFLTRSTSAVLQLAISMDYAIFLLHRFAKYRHEGNDVHPAMVRAVSESAPVIAASAATTAAGFLVLMLMRFRIGPDMGLVLAKGILCSFVSVMVLLPVLTVSTASAMEKTHHRPLLPSFGRAGNLVMRIGIPLALVLLVLLVPAYLGQRSNTFLYGSSGIVSEGSRIQIEAEAINAVFGNAQQMVLLVPDTAPAKEALLTEQLRDLAVTESVTSYANTVGIRIPEGYLDPDVISVFRSGGYSRILLDVAVPAEGDASFSAVADIRTAAEELYGSDTHLIGQSAVNYDLKETITADNRLVNIAVLLAIGTVLLLTFRSLALPLILLLAIRGATWINLSIPYFSGHALNYIGYLIISSVQLGATVDYGILFVQQYSENRKLLSRKEAAGKTLSGTALSILTPALILFISGLILGSVSTNAMIGQFGVILGRGAILSAAIVLLALPGLLVLLDRAILKTTYRGSLLPRALRKRKPGGENHENQS